MGVKIDLSGIVPLAKDLLGGDDDKSKPAPAPVVPAGPPPPKPPTPAPAGLGPWLDDPGNLQKVQDGITMPGQPLLPQGMNPPVNDSLFGGNPPQGPKPLDLSAAPPASAPADLTGIRRLDEPAPGSLQAVKRLPQFDPQAAPAAAATPATPGTVPTYTGNGGAPQPGGLKLLPFTGPQIPSQNPGPPSLASTLQTDQAEQQRLRSTGSGVSQIKNPVLRTLARIGDVAGTILTPGVAAAIPGTTLHNRVLQGQAGERVADDRAALTAEAALRSTQAQADQRRALATQEQAKAQALLTAKPEKPSTIEEQAYDFAVSKGRTPLEALQDVYGAKDTKNAPSKTLPEQYLEAMANGDQTKAKLIRQTINDTSVQPKIDIHNATAPASGVPASIPGQVSPLVQAIIDGRAPAPNSRSKAGMALMSQVTAIDPTYDASRYATYQAMQKEMTSGPTGNNINALNTLLEHVKTARTHLPDNSSISPWNAISNAAGTLTGSNPTGKFDTDAVGIGGEFGKLVSGGVATVDEQKHLQKLLDHNASPKTLSDNLDEIEELAHGKLAGIYKQVGSAAHPAPGGNMPSSLPEGSGDVVEYVRDKNGKLVRKGK